jgi:hypothetical protein
LILEQEEISSMSRDKKTAFFILTILLLMAGSVSAADDAIGFVAALRGKVVAVNSIRGERSLSVKDNIFINDTIKTGKRSRIQLVFADNTIISLGRTTVLNIAEYEWRSKQNAGKITSNIPEGIFRIMGGAIAGTNPEKFKTRTPSATIGIRGSMYAGLVRNNQLSVVFLGGRGIEVRNQAGVVEISEPGYGTRVSSSDTPPEEPTQFSITGFTDSDQVNGAAPDDAVTATETPSTDINGDIQGATADAVADSCQDTIQEDMVENIINSPSPAMTGNFLGVLLDAGDNAAARIWRGNTSGNSYTMSPTTASVNGQVSATALSIYGSAAGRTFSWANASAPYNPAQAFTGDIELNNQLREVADLVTAGRTETFDTMEVHYGLPGEFNATMLLAQSFDGSHSFFEAKSLGVPAPAPPSFEIMGYGGGGLGAYIDYGRSQTAIDVFAVENYYLEVNFHNHKAVGNIWETNAPPGLAEEIIKLYFIGDVNGTTINNIKFFGHGGTPDGVGVDGRIIAWNGSASGQFYGSDYQGISLSGSGNFFDMETSQTTATADFYLGLGGMKNPENISYPISPPQDTLTFSGFVTGISEDMTSPAANRRLFFSKNPTDLSFTVNQNTGEVSGLLSAEDLIDVANDLTNIQIGGTFASACTLSDWFVAELGCSTGSCVESGDPSDGLKNYGNYLATAELSPKNKISDHVNWGYWEISYDDPASGKAYHLHAPGSFWVAGQQTPTTEIKDLIEAKFTGTYNGQARGVHIDPSDMIHELPDGTTSLTIDFSSATPVSGSINFPGVVNLAVNSGASSLTTSGFNASFQGSGGSGMHGAFYGPEAAAVGGNFDAVQGSDRYQGIFIGER